MSEILAFLKRNDCFSTKKLLFSSFCAAWHPFAPLGVLLRVYMGFIHSVSSKMPPLTHLRKRLSLEEKVQLIDDSIKPGFNKANAMKKYGISQAGLYLILKNKKEILESFNNANACSSKSKSNRPAHFQNLEEKLFEWFLNYRKTGLMINGPLLKSKDKIESKGKQSNITQYFNKT